MSLKIAVAFFGFALLVVTGAFFIPSMLDASSGETDRSFFLEEEEKEILDGKLEISVEALSGNSVEGTILDTGAGELHSFDIEAGNEETFDFNGEDITVSVQHVSGTAASFKITYPSTFGYDENTLPIIENFDIMLIVMFFIAIMGGLASFLVLT